MCYMDGVEEQVISMLIPFTVADVNPLLVSKPTLVCQ